ncbi:DNA/RNA helicase [Kurthia zopfii]|uniref:Competence protein ComFA n=1 Tax=Kurthia zopfii TaxID=1650 RepID=A0A8B4Q733_9BACL|nr:DEAD/DEAH box helicase [Kurthia zopfii]TDR39239.1 competence protein ComFA [Kurthia zopfii]GEK31446.1 DNA/RNA helicase [Kurthia zopfii]STX08781.1 primosome assembly protein PriA [Kurthia zopfii]
MLKLQRRLLLPQKVSPHLFDHKLQAFLVGRIWIAEKMPFHPDTITYHIHAHFIEQFQGITEKNSCRRCGSQNLQKFDCSQCKGSCSYCLDCIIMGRISRCTKLLRWVGPPIHIQLKSPIMTWQGTLTPSQKMVADEAVRHEKDHLIHAVTGAGKTEILFPISEDALLKNQRICVTTPRTDVVLELSPRFQKAFEKIQVQSYYGGSEFYKEYSPLIIATTHQLLRFEAAFDVIIVDEADAFPYTFDEKLRQAVKKAKKASGRTILVTATPTKLERTRFSQRKCYSFIARRFHGKDLPVPKFDSLWQYDRQFNQGIIPRKLRNWLIKCVSENKPFLVFFPSVKLMMVALPLIQKIEHSILAVHASDPNRKESVQALRDGKVCGLLTTTILERGITIFNLQVAVVGAENRIFDHAALIQISGRVGRSKDAPSGDLIFFHDGLTRQMDFAVSEIKRLNRL